MATLTEITTYGPPATACKVCWAITNEPFGTALDEALASPASHAAIARADEIIALPYKILPGAIGQHRAGQCSGSR